MKQRRLTRDNCFSKDQIGRAGNDYTIENSRDSYDPDRNDAQGSRQRIQKRASEQFDDEETYTNISKEVEHTRKDFETGWAVSLEASEGPQDKAVAIAPQAHPLKQAEEVLKFYRTDHGYH